MPSGHHAGAIASFEEASSAYESATTTYPDETVDAYIGIARASLEIREAGRAKLAHDQAREIVRGDNTIEIQLLSALQELAEQMRD